MLNNLISLIIKELKFNLINSKTIYYLRKKLITMEKKNTHGGKRANAGAKTKPYAEKLQGISLTVKATGKQVDKYSKAVIKEAARLKAQAVVDRMK